MRSQNSTENSILAVVFVSGGLFAEWGERQASDARGEVRSTHQSQHHFAKQGSGNFQRLDSAIPQLGRIIVRMMLLISCLRRGAQIHIVGCTAGCVLSIELGGCLRSHTV